jgi:hypothetical protein
MKLQVTKTKDRVCEHYGILYLVHFELDGKSLVKIGVTAKKIEDRVSEILVSIFKKYREFPYCRPKRFQKTSDMFDKEAVLHQFFAAYHYTPDKVFSGSTEFFDLPIDIAVAAYEQLSAGEPLDASFLPPESG